MTALRFGLFALGLAACVAPSTGHAVDLALDPYVEYNAGLTLMRNQNLTRANPPGLSGRVESEPGFNVGGAIGTKFLQHFRTEINVGYRRNDVDRIAIQPGNNDGEGRLAVDRVGLEVRLGGRQFAEEAQRGKEGGRDDHDGEDDEQPIHVPIPP